MAPRYPRTATTEPELLPAHSGGHILIPQLPTHSFFSWTLGRGTVFWRIWPAVVFQSLFAAAVVYVSFETKFVLSVPPVLLTVLGMIIGFVISYRAMTGYDRYWMGRTCWSDIIRNTRTMARLIWYHVPPRLSRTVPSDGQDSAESILKREMQQIMAEKKMALDVLEGLAVATKHHLRGELGIYYEDLYHLIEPLHNHHPRQTNRRPQRTARPVKQVRPSHSSSSLSAPERSPQPPSLDPTAPVENPVIPPINSYGTFNGKQPEGRPPTRARTRTSDTARDSSPSSILSHRSVRSACSRVSYDPNSGHPYSSSHHHLLKPSMAPSNSETPFSKFSSGLIPFASFFKSMWVSMKRAVGLGSEDASLSGEADGSKPLDHTAKLRPQVAGGKHAQNLPLDILRCLSEWVSVLESRECVPGAATGGMLGCIAGFEDTLAELERILTTPLPFVYSVHISTVWIYLFFLPFQLIDQFGWSTIPGVAIAAFIYLGFLAAGEEIEQPFGYDENDLDLELFCRVIIREDLERLRRTPCFNAYYDSGRGIAGTVAESLQSHATVDDDDLLGFLS